MADFLFCAQPLAGHVTPALPIVASLVEQGHDVRFYTGRRYARQVERAGARFTGCSTGLDYDDEDLDRAFPARARRTGLRQFVWDLEQLFIARVPGQVSDLERELDRRPAAVLVGDPTFLPCYVLGERLGLPWATYGVTFLTSADPLVPPFGLGLRFRPGWSGRLRNRALTGLARTLVLRRVQTACRRAVAAAGGDTHGRWAFELPLSPYLVLQPSVPALEYPRRRWPEQLHFVGSSSPETGVHPLPAWWGDVVAAGSVVLVTQGTAQTDPEQLVLPTLRALADEPGTLVVGTIPGRDADQLRDRAPSNARLAPFVPFADVMPYVDVLVTNGGFGGVHAALAHGVPVVVAGTTEDKPEVANRVEHAGVGIRVRTGRPGAGELRAAVGRIRSDDSYRTRAREVQSELARAGGATRAAALLVRLAETGRPVPRGTDEPQPG